MGDPLTQLREAFLSGRKVYLDDESDEIVIGELRFPRNTPTSYRELKGKGNNYPLDAVWFCLQCQDKPYTDYFKESLNVKIAKISLLDRRDLLDYITGKKDNVEGIEKSALVPIPAAKPTHALADTEKQDSQPKRHRVEPSRPETAAPVEAPIATLSPEMLQRVLADKDATNRITQHERRLRTRHTALQSQKSFVHIVDMLAADEKKKKEEAEKKAKAAAGTAKPGHDRYNVSEGDFWKGRADFGGNMSDMLGGIDTAGTFNKEIAARLKSGQMAPAPAEKPSTSTPTKVATVPKVVPSPSSKPTGPPIIVVPAGITSILTVYNIHDFLESKKFVPTMEKKKSMDTKPEKVIVKKQLQKKIIPFLITDDTSRFKSEDWNRVVAVICNGQAWQFKDWHIPDPTELFVNVQGFFVSYDDEKPTESVKKWDVKKLAISRHKRHLDQEVVLAFWNHLEQFMIRKKREFL